MKFITKKVSIVLAILLFLPQKASAFINFCFPISSTLLIFVLGWPYVILYNFFGYQPSVKLLDINFITTGAVSNVISLIIFGIALDLWRRKKGYLLKKYWLKLPLIFLLFIVILFGLSFIDPTCWR